MRMIRLTEEYITRIVAGECDLPSEHLGPTALSVGSFDGLHRGHRELLSCVGEAKNRRLLDTGCVFTFRHHPRLVLTTDPEPFLLTTWREKLAALHEAQLDLVVAADFCPALARLDYRSFVDTFLVQYLGMKHFVAGYDAHLGADRRGNARTLEALGEELGYTLEVCSALREGGDTISSSVIRDALRAGDPQKAEAMLGRPYALWGEVAPGDGRGRTIGYPTANVVPLDPYKLLPAPGVYAVRVQMPGDIARVGRQDGVLGHITEALPEVDRQGDLVSTAPSEWVVFGGMLNYGKVPTFHGEGLPVPRVEAHIFSFDGDLRGRTIKIEFLRRLRAERKFAGVEELVAQLRIDEVAARTLLGLNRSSTNDPD
jgi:riboflavin kinase/FMN adenylyltransferase